MKIQTPPPQSARLLSYLDSRLSSGKMPDPQELKKFDTEVYLSGIHDDTAGTLYVRDRGVADLGPQSGEFQNEKKQVLFRGATQAGLYGAIGAVVGSQAGPWGALVGAAAGALIGFDNILYRETGKVQVKVDGEEQQARRFFGNPATFEFQPEELQLRLKTQGFLGDRIRALEVPDLKPDAQALAQWKAAMKTLKGLARERRLVADLGGMSDYGKPSLHLVTALQAVELLASGVEVSLVSGEHKDLVRTLEVDCGNRERSRSHHERHQFVERQYGYELLRLAEPKQLSSLPSGEGLPEGMLGVLRDSRETVAIVGQSDQNQEIAIAENSTQQAFVYQRRVAAPNLELEPNSPQYSIVKHRNFVPLATVSAAALGGLVAQSINPAAGLVGMVGAGLLGREIGRYLTGMSKISPRQPSLRIRYED